MGSPIALGADYAARHGRDQLRCLRQAGVSFVVRYFAPDAASWKRLTQDEVADITAEGLALVSVYQYANNSPSCFTADAARRDAYIALECAQKLGQPQGTPIYFAVDFDAQYEHLDILRAYFDVIRNALAGRYRVGVYGSYRVVEALATTGHVDRCWQTYAWSGGKVSPRAHMLQFRNGANLCGGSNDINLAWRDPGWWPKPPASTALPQLPTLQRGAKGWQVAMLQALLARGGADTGGLDGVFGPKTEAAVRALQQARGLAVDGIAGPATWGALLADTAPAPSEPDWRALYEQERARREKAEQELERLKTGLRVLLG